MHYYDQAKDLINKQEYKKALIILNTNTTKRQMIWKFYFISVKSIIT